jgi:protein TonB
MSGLSEELAEKVSASLPVHVGDTLGRDQIRQIRAALTGVDEHLTLWLRTDYGEATLTIMLRPTGIAGDVTGRISGGVPGGVVGGITNGTPGILMLDPSSAATQFPAPASGVERIRVGGNVQALNLTKKVTPTYPALAKQARIQGVVRFTALIGTDGSITSLQLIEGHPLLVESAQQAVSQWQYKPTLLNGDPVEVITQIDVNYTLSQ